MIIRTLDNVGNIFMTVDIIKIIKVVNLLNVL